MFYIVKKIISLLHPSLLPYIPLQRAKNKNKQTKNNYREPGTAARRLKREQMKEPR